MILLGTIDQYEHLTIYKVQVVFKILSSKVRHVLKVFFLVCVKNFSSLFWFRVVLDCTYLLQQKK